MQNKHIKKILLIIIIFFVPFFLRSQFLTEPFERDEGEYAYLGWRITKGELPYRDIFNQKFPGIHYLYAAIIKFYGPDYVTIRLWVLILGIISILLFYLLAERLYGSRIAFLSVIFFALFSGGPYIQGSSANCEPLMNFFIITGFYVFLLCLNKTNVYFLLPGLLLGLAFSIKQVAVFAFLALCCWLAVEEFYREKRIKFALFFRKAFFLTIGFFAPIFLFILYFMKIGIITDFINNTVKYNIEYVLHSASEIRDPFFVNLLKQCETLFVRENGIILLLAVFALLAIIIKRRTKENLMVLLWLFFAFISVCSGGRRLRFHYFIQMLPAMCMLAGISFTFLYDSLNQLKTKDYWKDSRNVFIIFVLTVMLVFNLTYQIPMYFIYSPFKVNYVKYGGAIFNEATFIADYIKENSNDKDTILVVGPEPEIYFYAQRKSATKYLLFYPLLFDFGQQLEKQKEASGEVMQNRPIFVVVTNWQGYHKPKERLFFRNVRNLLKSEYHIDGLVFHHPREGLKMIFGEEQLKSNKASLESNISPLAVIYKRSKS